MSAPRVAVVIVNHDHPEAVAAQLLMLLSAPAAVVNSTEIVVVQNGERKLESLHRPNVAFVDCDNRGYGSAVNVGVRHSQAPWVIALNADLVLTQGFLEYVHAVAAEMESAPRIGVVGGALFDDCGKRQGSFGPWPTLMRLLLGLLRERPYRRYWPTTSRLRDVPWVTGACFLFRRECWDKLGGFDEAFFMYYEDVDFCRRAWQADWRVLFSPRPAATHFQPYHLRPLTVAMARMARRSTLVYFWKHRPKWEFHVLARIILLECWWRRKEPGWSSIAELVRRVLADPNEIPSKAP
jgi:N-acetylglucosaminyl-diphospho-decaprenol L-rhamnosyltransferase